ncbi:CoA transferase [Azospirillum isscasi]|uniref:CoA transferase n=1 Tax=Azospirillum isscasi TaxID=3053926 RepID=A0ABU0WFU9_9PROT|nr:CoA transferase [Azospirillum isscasi]MDQ2103016.1 CoA transferase [Azospirillum isscasi]
MYDILKDLVVVEGASFIAGPSCALHLQQFGATVIRFDAIGGGPDHKRWPQGPSGDSLYWESLNKGKLSVAIDLARPEGRELAIRIVTAPGEGRGLFVTNYPRKGFLSHENLAVHRPDLITLRVQGWPDGRNGVDYTVNAAVGVPYMTGDDRQNGADPVNSTVPAWDLLAGAYGAFALMCAERRRRRTGEGGEIRVALSDIAIGSLAHLGQVAEVLQGGDRGRFGNALYGAFGRNFAAKDGRQVMIVAITPKQWRGLVDALGVAADVAALEDRLDVSFAVDEGQRFIHREALGALFALGCARLDYDDLAALLERGGVCWEPYRTLREAVAEDPRLVRDNAIFAEIRQVSGAVAPVPGALARFEGLTRQPPKPAARLGADTERVLAEHLGLGSGEIGRLVDQGLVAVA